MCIALYHTCCLSYRLANNFCMIHILQHHNAYRCFHMHLIS
uniref:Uncharacterized protein n=1 Tax=Rhizophora mucronata TaxID=61149 RepID=A0A2P2N099_RHIMU